MVSLVRSTITSPLLILTTGGIKNEIQSADVDEVTTQLLKNK